MIIPHNVIRQQVIELYQAGGLPKGDSTGWKSLDKLYTVGMHQFTMVTGLPNSGKSEWLDALMVNLARQGDWRFFIFSPENLPMAHHHSKFIEKYIGKPFNPGPNERIEPDEIHEAEDWMETKFHFCRPEVAEMETILVEAISSVVSLGKQWKTGVVIDPWNWLEHRRPAWMSETEYVSDCLTRVIERVREYNVHLWLVAHPAKMQRNKDGNYSRPTPRDISGSAHFWNKSDNCITVWRDLDTGSQEVRIYIDKVRWKHMGHIGDTTLLYDRITGRYAERASIANYYNKDDE